MPQVLVLNYDLLLKSPTKLLVVYIFFFNYLCVSWSWSWTDSHAQQNYNKDGKQGSVMWKTIEVSVYSCIYKVIPWKPTNLCTGYKQDEDSVEEIIIGQQLYHPSAQD